MPVEDNLTKTSGITKDGALETELALISTTNTAAIMAADDHKSPSMNNGEKKKKKGPFSFFRAALVALQSDSKKKPVPKVVDEVNNSNGNWKKIVGSMRPLHLQDNQSPPPSLRPTSPPPRVESLEDLNQMMIQQQPSSPVSSSVSGGTMSQYASACNLQELDNSDGEDDDNADPDEVFDALRGDEMIDAKAEEFIAQFYQQMKLQHIDYGMSRHHSHHHHHHHNHKGKSQVEG